MNRDALYAFMRTFFEDAEALSRKKNADYAQNDDPFQNFSQHGEKGFVTRMSDKMTRLSNLIDRQERHRILAESGTEAPAESGVDDESIEDTIMDLFNYCWLLAAFRWSRTHRPSTPTIVTSSITHEEEVPLGTYCDQCDRWS